MRNYRARLIVFAAVLLILTACGTNNAEGEVSPQIEAGQRIFQANCAACHTADSDEILVGPSMVGLVERAGTTVEGLDAQAYIRQSILDPAAHINDGFSNVMPNIYGSSLSEEDMSALIAYLMTFE